MLLQMLAAMRQGGGQSSAGESNGPAMRELQGEDPNYALRIVQQMKRMTADLIPVLAQRNPGANRALAAIFKNLDAAIKELQRGVATANAVGGPIESSTIPRPQPPGGTGAPQLVMGANRTM